MRTHACIDDSCLGIPVAFRRWVSMTHSKWAFEFNLKHRYTTIGFDLFDDEHVISAHFAIPFLWLSLSFASDASWSRKLGSWFRTKFGSGGRSFKIAYHDHSAWWSFFETDDHNRADPWWMRQSFYMPWHSEWVSTEILSLDLERTVWKDKRRSGRRMSDNYEARKAAELANSFSTPYQYILKSGEVQNRVATAHVERMSHGYRWFPLPINKRVSIWVSFDQEVGEDTGSWKGGTTGCGYTLKKGETPLGCLHRMEQERKFSR